MSKYPKMKGGEAPATPGHSKGGAARPRPFPANDPIPWSHNPFKDLGKAPAKVLLPKLAKKFLPKLIPGAGAALTAYEAYQWFKDGSKVVPNPVLYSVERTCNGGSVTVIANRAQFTCNAWFANLGTAAANNTWPNHSNWGRIWTGRFSHIQYGNELLPLHIQ